MPNQKMLFAFVLVIALCGAGCNSDPAPTTSGGPIDGSYLLTGLTCDGNTTPFIDPGMSSATLVISNAVGSWVTLYVSTCVATEGNVFSYPSSTTITLQKVNKTCSASCGGAECMPNSNTNPATTETYTRSGSTLTFTHTSIGGNDPCNAGETAIFTFTKQ